MAVSMSALMGINPTNTIVSFWYEQLGSSFMTKTTERRTKDENGNTITTGSRKETVKAVLGCEIDDIICVSRRQGRLGVKLDYKSTIDRAIAKKGGDPIEWTPKEKNGFVAVDGYHNMLWKAVKDGRIALQVYDYTTLEKTYYIVKDGKREKVEKSTLEKFFPAYKERFFTIDGEAVLVDGEPINMKGITPKSFYLDQMSDLKIKGQIL